MTPRRGAGAWVAVLPLLLAGAAAHRPAAAADGVTIAPVVIEIGSPRKVAAITLTNNGSQAVTYQVQASAWRQRDGADLSEENDDLLVVPAIVDVPPGASQVLRVMLRSRAPAPVERSYWILLENITRDVALAATSAVSFKLSHKLPVMIAPAGKVVHALRWLPCAPASAAASASDSAGAPQACVRLHNDGNRRVKIRAIELAGDGWRQPLVLPAGLNLLAGAQREWSIPLAPEQTGPVRAVSAQTADAGMLQAEAAGL